MRKILLTLFVLATASCGEQASPTVKFRRAIDDPNATPKRPLLLALDDPEHRYWFDQIAVSGNYLYFNLPWRGVYRMPKYGGDVSPIEEAQGVEDFRGVAVNGTDVYWARQSAFGSVGVDFGYTRVRGQALAGGPARTVAEGGFAIASDFNESSVFFARPDAVYGAVTYPRSDFYDLTRFPADGSAMSASLFRFDLGFPDPKTYGMATDEEFAYVSVCPFGTTSCPLIRVNLRTSETETLVTFTAGETIVAIDSTHLYLAAGHQLLKLPKAGGEPAVVLATFEGDVYLDRQGLVDEANVFVESGSRALWSVPKEGGVPRIMATDFPGGIDHLAQDEGNIFVMYGYEAIDIVPKTASAPIP